MMIFQKASTSQSLIHARIPENHRSKVNGKVEMSSSKNIDAEGYH